MKPRFILVISRNPFGFGYKIPTTIQKQLNVMEIPHILLIVL